MESPTMYDSDALLLMVAGYIGRDVVPWLGARLVEAAVWCGPRIDRLLDALLRPRSVKAVNELEVKP
jgi:hypothetical protein